jgi:hypothetical protein
LRKEQIMSRHPVAAMFLSVALGLAFFPKADGHYDAQGRFVVSAARGAALRECSARANEYPEWEYGNTPLFIYRACMAEHGQVE